MNNFFDKIYCINLDRRPDRWSESVEEFKKINLIVERIPAIDGSNITNNTRIKNGALALMLTVKNIIKDSIENNFDRILILEDDIEFTEDINLFSENIKHLPTDWDLLYFGGNHNVHAGSKGPISVNEYFNKLHNTYTTHAVGFNRNGLLLVRDILEHGVKEIDVLYADLQKNNNVYCFNKLMATQRVSYSDIENVVVDYKKIIE